MKSSKTILFLGTVSLFLSTQAFALPVAGTIVTMANDWYVPYTMIASDGEYQTFCLEHNNYFSPGTTYSVQSVGDTAYGGGVLGTSGDPVDDRTEKLYAAYFTSGIFGAEVTAQKVQNAIWYLESEGTTAERSAWQSDWTTLSANNNFINFVASDWKIVAVNLTDRNSTDIQSQLVGVHSVPEPSLILLLGTGTIGLVGISRRRKK